VIERVRAMARRLPQLYRGGELLRGTRGRGGLLDVPAVQLEILDEEMRRVQRTHWFDATYELEHAARLGALLDIKPEPWQTLDTYRAWLHALRDAILIDGGVTVPAIRRFVSEYAAAFEKAEAIDTDSALEHWSRGEGDAGPQLIENPPVLRRLRFPEGGSLEPLTRFTVKNRGTREAYASFLMTGSSRGEESAPVVINVTTKRALVFLGSIPEGKRLWIRATADGVKARLELEDVTGRLRSVSGVVPGQPWTRAQVESPATPLMLGRGDNELWFIPLAHFDVRGLDRFLLSMPDIGLTQARYESAHFDGSLFYQEPLMRAFVAWQEEKPASFSVHLPARVLRSRRKVANAVASRELLARSLAIGVERLRAAGVTSEVVLEPFGEWQQQLDTLRQVLPVTFREGGPAGSDGLLERGGAFEVSNFDDSVFR
jgi:hypothetical protein